jgi:hypothetical protein
MTRRSAGFAAVTCIAVACANGSFDASSPDDVNATAPGYGSRDADASSGDAGRPYADGSLESAAQETEAGADAADAGPLACVWDQSAWDSCILQ